MVHKPALLQLACLLLCTVSTACQAGFTTGTPLVPAPPTFQPPVVSSMPGLVGQLWMDRSLGELWEITLPEATVTRIPVAPGIFPIQPAVPLSGAPLSYAGATKATGNRYGIYVNDALVLGVSGDVSYEDPAWSPDGSTLYLTRIGVPADGQSGSARMSRTGLAIQMLATGSLNIRSSSSVSATTLVDDAFQPASSYDGKWLAYTYVDVANPMSPTKSVHLLDLEAHVDRQLVPPQRFYDVYGPRFLPNNVQILFSAADDSLRSTSNPQTGPLLAIVNMLLPVHVAQAHSWTGDIWRVNRDGTGLARLTMRKFQSPVAAPAPDGRHIAIVSGEGLFIMNADGSGLVEVSQEGSNGNITWSN